MTTTRVIMISFFTHAVVAAIGAAINYGVLLP